MMRQKLALVVRGSPSLALSRMNGFSPVRITRFGSAGIAGGSLLNEMSKVTLTLASRKVCRFRHSRVERPDAGAGRGIDRYRDETLVDYSRAAWHWNGKDRGRSRA